tara:strand:- start:2413 stop:3522 length:1110 start_codon:yes stop_codon:yes gene_type:complete
MAKMDETQLRDFLMDLDEGTEPVEEVAAQEGRFKLVGDTKKSSGAAKIGKDGKWQDGTKESGKTAEWQDAKPAQMSEGMSKPEIGEMLMEIPFDADMDEGLIALGLLDPKTLASMTGKGPLSTELINEIINARSLWPKINELRKTAGTKGRAHVKHNRSLEKIEKALVGVRKGYPAANKGLYKTEFNARMDTLEVDAAWRRIQKKHPQLAKIAWKPKAINAAHAGIDYEARQQATRVRDNQAGYGPGKGLKHSGAMKLVGRAMLPLGALHAIGFALNYESDAAAMDSDRKLNTMMEVAAGRSGKPVEDLNMQDMMEEAYELSVRGKGPWVVDGEVRPEMQDLYDFMQEHGVGVSGGADPTGISPGPSSI